MNRLRIFLPLVSVMLFLGACQQSGSSLNEIERLEKRLNEVMANPAADARTAMQTQLDSVITAYETFIAENGAQKLSADRLFNLSEMYESAGKYNETLETLNTLITTFPKEERAADALFKIGFIQHNRLGDLPKAEAAYKSFIAQHPEHHFADDAQMELDNLGVPPEEIIRRAQEKARQDSINAANANPAN